MKILPFYFSFLTFHRTLIDKHLKQHLILASTLKCENAIFQKAKITEDMKLKVHLKVHQSKMKPM